VSGDRSTDRSDVTELSGLTSDPVCTADRSRGILIFSGPVRKPPRGLNPFEADRGPAGETTIASPIVSDFAFVSQSAYPLKHTESGLQTTGV
jgi:hypothetical protein